MPKKFKGENTKKTVSAKERQAAKRHAEEAERKKAIEDQYWKDDDKQATRKEKRKEEREQKKVQQQQKKKENQELYESDVAAAQPTKSVPKPKVTRNMIEIVAEKQKQKLEKEIIKKDNAMYDEREIEENINKLQIDDGARTIDEAISMMGHGKTENHPEKRMKAAYLAYEEANLQRLRDENPSLRITQVKQILWKDFLKSQQSQH